jgi:hypothetical protein
MTEGSSARSDRGELSRDFILFWRTRRGLSPHSLLWTVRESDGVFMATNPTVDGNLASADDLLVRLLEHVEANKSADLQLVALTAKRSRRWLSSTSSPNSPRR